MKRLSVVVPYRDRQAHLRDFVAHVSRYFARDKLDKHVPYRVMVVEQAPGLPFNAGTLKNIGFLLSERESDYTCFHDVDYLPVWADYSWSDQPAHLVCYGAENRPIRVGDPSLGVVNPHANFFGGVVLVPNTAFRLVNGYSNDYWGWGREDADLLRRFINAGLQPIRRKGTFAALDHDNRGWVTGTTPSEESERTQATYVEKWRTGRTVDGLSSVAFEVLHRGRVPNRNTERAAVWEIVTVQLARDDELGAQPYGEDDA